MKKLEFAKALAIRAHDGQTRKWVGEPYAAHAIRVANMVRRSGASDEAVMAAYLPDVVEDTHVTLEELRGHFGDRVADLVWHVSEISDLRHGNRATRKAMDMAHYVAGPPEAHTIKLADIIDNATALADVAPSGFAKIYISELSALALKLTDGDKALHKMAMETIDRNIWKLIDKPKEANT